MKSAQQALEESWCQLLDVDQAAPDQNFYDLGGDSLIALDLFTLVAEQSGWELPIDVLFTVGTYKALAETAPS